MSAQPNAELAWRVIDHIDAHPEQHDQDAWIRNTECGTTACFAGLTTILAGDRPVMDLCKCCDGSTDLVTVDPGGQAYDMRVRNRAQDLLGLDGPTSANLFFARDLDEVRAKVAEIFGPRPGEHINCAHDPEGADGNPFASMICSPRPGGEVR